MKVFFAAQGSILSIFHSMDEQLRRRGVIEKSAYWVADSEYYHSKLGKLALLTDSSTKIFKEWEYTDSTRLRLPDNWQALEKKYESVGPLWDAIVADRRLMHGLLCKTKQQYRGHFTHEELKAIIYSALHDIDEFVLDLRPDRVVTFVPATFGDNLLYFAALANGIEYRVLRSTKVENYVAFSDQLGASSTWMEALYIDNLVDQESKEHYQKACEFLANGADAPIDYEGSLATKRNTVFSLIKRYIAGAAGAAVITFRRIAKGIASDNHLPPALGTYFHGNLLREIREKRIRNIMRNRQFSIDDIGGLNYVFYPMHCEPEVALSVYGREHQNQIETIRRVAQNIPLSWKLVVKEHPRSISYRSKKYCEKLLDIPNLVFADPDTKPFYWNQKSRAVVTVSGFAGFEAAMVGVPVIVLGDASFSLLPSTMLRTVKSMEVFAAEMKSLLQNYSRSERHLIAYIMANMQVGVDVNLYSDLLAKTGRISMNADDVATQISRLTDWMMSDLHCKHPYQKNLKLMDDKDE